MTTPSPLVEVLAIYDRHRPDHWRAFHSDRAPERDNSRVLALVRATFPRKPWKQAIPEWLAMFELACRTASLQPGWSTRTTLWTIADPSVCRRLAGGFAIDEREALQLTNQTVWVRLGPEHLAHLRAMAERTNTAVPSLAAELLAKALDRLLEGEQ